MNACVKNSQMSKIITIVVEIGQNTKKGPGDQKRLGKDHKLRPVRKTSKEYNNNNKIKR